MAIRVGINGFGRIGRLVLRAGWHREEFEFVHINEPAGGTDAVFEVKRATTVEEVNQLFKAAAAGELAGILGYEERPLVSSDYVNDPRSAIVDAGSTMVVDGTLVKIFAWYDNEWGYANRLAELTGQVARLLPLA